MLYTLVVRCDTPLNTATVAQYTLVVRCDTPLNTATVAQYTLVVRCDTPLNTGLLCGTHWLLGATHLSIQDCCAVHTGC